MQSIDACKLWYQRRGGSARGCLSLRTVRCARSPIFVSKVRGSNAAYGGDYVVSVSKGLRLNARSAAHWMRSPGTSSRSTGLQQQ